MAKAFIMFIRSQRLWQEIIINEKGQRESIIVKDVSLGACVYC